MQALLKRRIPNDTASQPIRLESSGKLTSSRYTAIAFFPFQFSTKNSTFCPHSVRVPFLVTNNGNYSPNCLYNESTQCFLWSTNWIFTYTSFSRYNLQCGGPCSVPGQPVWDFWRSGTGAGFIRVLRLSLVNIITWVPHTRCPQIFQKSSSDFKNLGARRATKSKSRSEALQILDTTVPALQ